MPSVITDGKIFQFKQHVLHGALSSWNHRIGIRLAVHEYLKRDGGEVEPMGAAPGRFSYRVVFIGPDVTARYNELVLSIRREPRGLLVDPRLGRLRVGCEGIDARETPEEGVDVIECELHFVEDAVDTALAEPAPGVHQLAAQVSTSMSGLSGLVPAAFAGNLFTSVQAVNLTLARLVAVSATFTEAALAAVSAQTPAQELEQLLGSVQATSRAFQLALLATLPDTRAPAVSLTPMRLMADQVAIGCLKLYLAVQVQGPAIQSYSVPQAMPLTQIATALYGQDAVERLPVLRTLNRIRTPYWVPQGTVLQILAPTAKQ